MRILIVGSGSREHALAWKLGSAADVERVVVAPGNAGTDGSRGGVSEAKISNAAIPTSAHDEIAAFAKDEHIDLVVVGPEAPLVAGLADRLRNDGLLVFGPDASAARLEGSKAFSKELMRSANVPTADFGVFTDVAKAREFYLAQSEPFVVKADGLAAGKGVVVPSTMDEGIEAIEHMLVKREFGDAGATLVLERRLRGQEVSFHVLTDGERYVAFGSAQDHKRLLAGDRGPNTGGMGAYSPPPVFARAVEERALREIVEPTLAALRAAKSPMRGALFCGLMVEDDRATVLEFNVRFGDPECAALMMRVSPDDALALVHGCASGALPTNVALSNESSLAVVLASKGYPTSPQKGAVIHGLVASDRDDVRVFHAGTAFDGDSTVVSGGRVLTVAARAPDLREAARLAYESVARVSFDGMQFRADVGHHALG